MNTAIIAAATAALMVLPAVSSVTNLASHYSSARSGVGIDRTGFALAMLAMVMNLVVVASIYVVTNGMDTPLPALGWQIVSIVGHSTFFVVRRFNTLSGRRLVDDRQSETASGVHRSTDSEVNREL